MDFARLSDIIELRGAGTDYLTAEKTLKTVIHASEREARLTETEVLVAELAMLHPALSLSDALDIATWNVTVCRLRRQAHALSGRARPYKP